MLKLISQQTSDCCRRFYSTYSHSSNFFSCYSSASFILPTEMQMKAKRIEVPNRLLTYGLIENSELKVPTPISIDLVKQVHDHEFVDKFMEGRFTEREMKRMGFDAWNEQIRNRVFHTIGATVCATRDALELNQSRRSSNLAGGGHHAFSNRGAGFCIWNDIVIAGQYVINCGLAQNGRKYLVIDLDVHQGDGTAQMSALLHPNQSFTFSMHCKHNFPTHKQQSNWDVELEDGVTDSVYLSILSDCLKVLESELKGKIDCIFFQSGVDVLKGDRMGRLSLSLDGVLKRDQMVCEFAERMSQYDPLFSHHTDNKLQCIPLISMMGGGYSSDGDDSFERVVTAHINTVVSMRSHWQLDQNNF